MREEQRKLSRDIGWIVGLGLLGVVAAKLIDPGTVHGNNGAGSDQDKIGAADTHHSG